MPTYPYQCHACGEKFDVYKRFAEVDRLESCPACQVQCPPEDRYISRTHFYGASDWDKAEWNPAFGCVVKNGRHRARLAKERGLIEVGNECPNKAYEKLERDRNEKIERGWAEIDRGHVPIE